MRRHALEVQRLQQACIATTAAANIKQPTSKVREDRVFFFLVFLSSWLPMINVLVDEVATSQLILYCKFFGTSSLPQLEEDYQRVIQALEEEMGRLRAETEKAEEEKMTVHKLNFELKKEVRSEEES